MSDTLEHTARRIAERGHEALIERLRPAFAEAAARHAEVLTLDPDQLEGMVQRAAERADGLQWRRALASVAVEELGISLSEALTHPAVARAHTIVGAPSYEDSVAKLAPAGTAAPARTPATPARPAATPARPAATPSTPAATPSTPAATPSTPAATPATPARTPVAPAQAEAAGEREGERVPEPVVAAPEAAGAETGVVALAAIHLGGVANLAPTESEIELRIAEDGLQLVRSGQVFERLSWAQIRGVEVHDSRRLRRRGHGAQLLLRSERGEASFEIRGVGPKELRERLGPLLTRR